MSDPIVKGGTIRGTVDRLFLSRRGHGHRGAWSARLPVTEEEAGHLIVALKRLSTLAAGPGSAVLDAQTFAVALDHAADRIALSEDLIGARDWFARSRLSGTHVRANWLRFWRWVPDAPLRNCPYRCAACARVGDPLYGVPLDTCCRCGGCARRLESVYHVWGYSDGSNDPIPHVYWSGYPAFLGDRGVQIFVDKEKR